MKALKIILRFYSVGIGTLLKVSVIEIENILVVARN